MLSLAAARSLIEQHVQPLEPVATPLAVARGHILREDIFAPDDLPAFDRSAMDGYAIDAKDLSPKFRVVMEVQAGQAPAQKIGPGECARIFTGAPIPGGASQVIMQEDVERDGEWITLRERDKKTWIRYRGEDARQGELLLAAGVRLRAGELSLLAQLGTVQPRVGCAPRVIHFATGNELVDPSAAPGPGQIRDSNSTLITALLADVGAHLVAQDRCGDALDTLVQAIRQHLAESWDCLLISGGASVGDYDFGTRALAELGFQVHFGQMSIRPGKPLVFATRGGQIAFVIPGNPVSHFVTFQIAIRLALERLEGAVSSWETVSLELAEDLPAKPNERHTLWPVHVGLRDGALRVWPLSWQSSGDLRGLLGANALVPIAPGAGGAKKGDCVDCVLLAALP
ncbi:MAG: gephyrin-like molybdotransferase Glp [Chthoniobacter sp.]|uniref:molybdopterin molybdotransferase MoeA n=1 Tax=Chthoniobacter sp. TaxID=2510640 RepID=UPI0032A97A63